MTTRHSINKRKDWFQLAIIFAILILFTHYETNRKRHLPQKVVATMSSSIDFPPSVKTQENFSPFFGIQSNSGHSLPATDPEMQPFLTGP